MAATRAELLEALRSSREELDQAIAGLGESDLASPGVAEGWSAKDLLAHITAWEAEMLKALGQARLGRKPTGAVVESPDVDALNARWQKETAKKPLDKVLADMEAARKQTIKQVERLTDEDLNDPRKYAWLKGTTLAELIAGETFEHEREHAAQIRKWRAATGK